MVGDIKSTFSQWINNKRDNKGKRPENGQNRRNLGGGEKNSMNFRGARKSILVKFNIWWCKCILRPKKSPFQSEDKVNKNKIMPGAPCSKILNPP